MIATITTQQQKHATRRLQRDAVIKDIKYDFMY